MKNIPNLPVLVIIRGVPGSGKTFFANKLANIIGKNKCINLDPDSTDYNSQEYKQHINHQLQEGVDEKLHPYRFLRAKAYKAIIDRKIILWNQPFTDLAIMKNVTDRHQEFALDQGTELPIVVLEVVAPKEVAWQRIVDRVKSGGHGPSKDRFLQFYDQYQSASSNGYDCITINGLENNASQLNEIAKKINSLTTNF